jgi:hypothetical protein
MKRLLVVASVVFATTSGPRAHARPQAYSTDKSFGLGIMLGAPSGLSGKYYLGRSSAALDFAVGSYYEFYYHHGTELHADVLWHPVVLANTSGFALPFYLGVGGRVLEHDDYYDGNRYYEHDTHIGVRVPFGLAFDFKQAPLDLFVELVPVVDLTGAHHYGHDFDITGALGLRYYF